MGAGPLAPSGEHVEKLRGGLDAACAEAARLISQADVLLLCTGAGFSADSGLAVYADVAKVKAYADRGLQYHDICQPKWLRSNPELFWGFWGQCYNDYRDTAPHAGYEIINRWVEERFRHSATAKAIRGRLEHEKKAASLEGDHAIHGAEVFSYEEESPGTGKLGPYEVTDCAGAFFVFTSNVDAHHFDWFRACEIRECHGNTELYQCAEADDHCQPVWRIPLDFRFQVDKDTMLAPDVPAAAATGPAPDAAQQEEAPAAAELARSDEEPTAAAATAGQPEATPEPAPEAATEGAAAEAAAEAPATPAEAPAEAPATPAEEAVEDSAEAEVGAEGAAGGSETEASREEPVARVGRVLGAQRSTTLRHMPEAPHWTSFRGFRSNHPICPFCGGKARPAILMFGDMEWQDVGAQSRQWKQWRNAVRAHAEDLEEKKLDPPRVVILEIGAGGNVTTVRSTSEQQLRAFLHVGAVAHMIRVNPEYPLGDEDDFSPDGDSSERVVSVMTRGLDAIQRIELAMDSIREKEAEAAAAAAEAQRRPEGEEAEG